MCSCYDTKLSTNILISNVIRVKIGRNYISDLVTSNFKQCYATITSHKRKESVWALQNSQNYLLKWMEKKKPQFIRVFKKIIHLMKILNFKEQHLTFPLGNFIWVCNIQKCAVGNSFNLFISQFWTIVLIYWGYLPTLAFINFQSMD